MLDYIAIKKEDGWEVKRNRRNITPLGEVGSVFRIKAKSKNRAYREALRLAQIFETQRGSTVSRTTEEK